MKKTLLLTLALALAGASSIMAGTVDIYVTGSTAFRQSAYAACTKLFVNNAPSIWYANAVSGGANTGFSASTGSWVMSGTPVGTLTNLQNNTLVVHGLFTGSIQGIQTVEQSVPLLFAAPHSGGTGTGGLTDTYVTNTPTLAFSDASGDSAGFPAIGNYAQEDVCVQPFVMCKSASPNSVMANINNITWEELEAGIPQGRLPFSVWTGNLGADNTNNFVYIIQRTADSGTRRCETAQEYYQFGNTVGIYVYDFTNKFFFQPNNFSNSLVGSYPFGVVGAAGNNNANLSVLWGPGYVSGGNIATELGYRDTTNTSISYLSMNDSRTITTTNWSQVVSFNGLWPTTDGANINTGTTTNNNYAPITQGYYPCWGNEVLVTLVDPSLDPADDQNISKTQLGDNTQPGTFLGVFNAQTLIYGGSPVVGSIENELDLSKTNGIGATGIPLVDMTSSRSSVGGVISPN